MWLHRHRNWGGGTCGNPRTKLRFQWENHRTKWGILQQAMFEYQMVKMPELPAVRIGSVWFKKARLDESNKFTVFLFAWPSLRLSSIRAYIPPFPLIKGIKKVRQQFKAEVWYEEHATERHRSPKYLRNACEAVRILRGLVARTDDVSTVSLPAVVRTSTKIPQMWRGLFLHGGFTLPHYIYTVIIHMHLQRHSF